MRSRLKFIALVFVMAAIGLAIALTSYRVDTLAAENRDMRADNTALEADLNEQEAASTALAEQVERLGGKPVVNPANPSAPPVALGPTNAQVLAAIKVICADSQSMCSPTPGQVRAAVTAICGGDCQGENGRDAEAPENGQNATAAQIDAAVSRHCGAEGCRGPGPTDQQVDERIAAHCADGRCRGEKGEKGDSIKGDTGSVTPGDYTCPDGEWITAIHVAEGGSMAVDCAPLIGKSE